MIVHTHKTHAESARSPYPV